MIPECGNCGSPLPDGIPVAEFCGACPPHRCDQCGGMDSIDTPCGCWVGVSDIAFADLKGMFAHDGFSLEKTEQK